MEYVIGIDSGGTNFRVRAAGLDGRLLGEYKGSTASHYSVSEDKAQERISHHIRCCLESFGGKSEDCRYLACGAAGLDNEADAALLNRMYGSLEGFSCPMELMNDAELALYTVNGDYGVLVISGTGSIAFGRNHQGREGRVGGWSMGIMGDEGSGSWVTRCALAHFSRYFDGAAPETELIRLVRERLNLNTREQLADLAAAFAADFENQPALGDLVDKAAAAGDAYAVRILERAAGETFSLASDLIQMLEMQNDADLAVGVWGSNIVGSPVHLEAFRRLVKEKYPAATVRLPQISALEGAVNLALERLKQRG